MIITLRDVLGLPDSRCAATSDQAAEFKQMFTEGMAGLNRQMQSLAGQVSRAEFEALEAQKMKLYEAFQKTSGSLDPQNPDKGVPLIERVMAAVKAVEAKASQLAAGITMRRDDWLKREDEFDNVLVCVGELEEAGNPKAAALRTLSETIRAKVNARTYDQSVTAFDQLRPKFDKIYQQHQQGASAPATNGNAQNAPGQKASEPPAPAADPNTENYKKEVLKVGSKGPAVECLQKLLGEPTKVDGKFGPATQQAVKDFQKSKGLKVDGIVGEKTWGALGGGASPAKGEAPDPKGNPAPAPPTQDPVNSQDPVKSTPGATGDVTIHGFDEYAVDVSEIRDPGAQEKLRELAHRIVASQQTPKPITAVEVHGHADLDLRSKPDKREQHELEVSRDRAKNALQILVKIISDDEQRPDVAGVIKQNSKTDHFGSKHRIHAPAKTESQMKENRRVEFFLQVGGKPTGGTGNLSVLVVTRDTRQPIPNAQVLPAPLFDSPPPKPQQTDDSGQVDFDDLPVGKYKVSAQVDDGKVVTAEVTVSEGVTELLTLEIDSAGPPVPPPTGTGLTVLVLLKTEVGVLPARGASVQVVNVLNDNLQFGPKPTDNKGQADFDDLPVGKYRVTAQVDKDKSSTGEAAVSEGVIELLTLEIASTGPPVPPKNARKAIFTVTDEATNAIIKGAIVKAEGMSEPTGNGGQATLDLVPGEHEFEVTAQGFEPFKGTIKVTTNDETERHAEMKAVKLSGVDVRMQVVDNLGQGLTASVKMDSLPRPFDTNRDGALTLKNVPLGTHKYLVTTSEGFLAKRGSVEIKEGETSPVRENVEMEPVRIVFLVKDQVSGEAIEGAIVGLGTLEPKPTDGNGTVEFSLLPPGIHKFLVTAKGHEERTGKTVDFTKERESNGQPNEVLLPPTNAGPPNGTINFAKLKGPFDLSQLHDDLNKTQRDVRAAIEAEKTMESTAKSEGINLDRPEDAVGTQKITLSDDDKEKLKLSLEAIRNTRGDMVNISHQLRDKQIAFTTKTKELKTKIIDKLGESFWNDLEDRHDGAHEDIERLIDMGKTVLKIAEAMEKGPVLAIIEGIGESDVLKELLKDEKDKSKIFTDRIKKLGEKYQTLVETMGKATVQDVLVLQGAIKDLQDDYATKQIDYEKEYRQHAKIVDRLSSGAGSAIPPQFAKTHAAVMKAALLSETARSVLPTQTRRSVDPRGLKELPTDKAEFYMIYFNQFTPKGDLIFDGTDTGMPGSIGGNVLVFKKEGNQFAYRESNHSLHRLVQQLDPVKHVFDSRRRLDELAKKWNAVLFDEAEE